MNHSLEAQIQAVLFYIGEPVSYIKLAEILQVSGEEIRKSVLSLNNSLKTTGLTVVFDGEKVVLGTSPGMSKLIEKVTRDELEGDLGRASLETLSIILYKSPVTKREIDYIRGVNSSFIIRNLLIRGLIERDEARDQRGYIYRPTLELLSHMGISSITELPEHEKILRELSDFVKKEGEESGIDTVDKD